METSGTVSDLCITCGLCCSGALFDRTTIGEAEAPFIRSIGMELVAEPKPDTDIIEYNCAQPCQWLEGTTCSRYGQQRPEVCGEFFCKLAKALQDGTIPFDHARQQVDIAKGLVTALDPFLLPGETLPQVYVRLGEIARKRPLPMADARLHLQGTALKLHLDAHFRKQSADKTPEGDATEGDTAPAEPATP